MPFRTFSVKHLFSRTQSGLERIRIRLLMRLGCRADIHRGDDYGVSPCDMAESEEMMRAIGTYKSVVMLENTAAFVLKVLYRE